MKKFILSLICILVFLGFSVKTLAIEKTLEIQLDKDYENCIFQISWENENEKAQVEIVDEAGRKFGQNHTPETTQVGEGRILISINKAKKGNYKVNISGDALGRVEVTGGELPGAMEIETFKVIKEEDTYRASWEVTDSSENLNFKIFADKDSKGYDGVEIISFNDSPRGEKDFTLNNLDNGTYYFYLMVSDYSGIFNLKYSEEMFFYNNPNSPGELEDVNIRMFNEDIYFTWAGENNRTFKIMIFDFDSKELIFEDITENDNYLWPNIEKKDKILGGVASYDYNNLGQFEIKEIITNQAPKAEVIFPEEDITNMKTILVNVSFSGDYTISSALNGEILIEDSKEQGDYRIDMLDGDNTIVFLIIDKEGNISSYSKELYVDSVAPQLSIKKDIHKSTTNNSYIYVEGYTEAGATLTLNGIGVEMIDGQFKTRVDLKTGKNEILLIAEDIAGNQSHYYALVHKSLVSSGLIYKIILGLIVIVLITIYMVVFIKGVKEKKK